MLGLVKRYTQDSFASDELPVVVLRQELTTVPVHWHDFYELVLVLHGESVHIANGVPQRVRAGSSMLLGPADFHAFAPRVGESLVCLDLVIDPTAAERHLTGQLLSHEPSKPWVIEGSTALADMERLRDETVNRRPGTDRVVDGLLACILVDFARRLSSGDRPTTAIGDPDEPVRAAFAYVEQHFREPLTLAAVAAQANLSPNYFSERFHQVIGLPFQTHLQQRRLRFARSLLASSDVTVGDAALAAGFGSASHLARAYRQRYGRSPSEDRPQIRSARPGRTGPRTGR